MRKSVIAVLIGMVIGGLAGIPLAYALGRSYRILIGCGVYIGFITAMVVMRYFGKPPDSEQRQKECLDE